VALRAVFDRIEIDPQTGLAVLTWASGAWARAFRVGMPAEATAERLNGARAAVRGGGLTSRFGDQSRFGVDQG
jgi:hypothetical protein